MIKAKSPRSKTYIVRLYKIAVRTSLRTQYDSNMKVSRRNALLIVGIIGFGVHPSGTQDIHKDLNSQSTVVILCTITIYIKEP